MRTEIDSLREQLENMMHLVASVERERDEWIAATVEVGLPECKKQLAACQKERDELAKALSKYGHHIEGCGHGWSCECGFYAALAKVGKGDAK